MKRLLAIAVAYTVAAIRRAPGWVIVCAVLFVGLSVAAAATVPTYYGSLNVPTGGTITDTNFASGQCVQTTVGGLLTTTGIACGNVYAFTSPLVNTSGTVACATCLTAGAQTIAGNKTFTGIPIVQPPSGNGDLYVITTTAAQTATVHVNAVTGGNALITMISGPTPGPSPAPGPYQLANIRFQSNTYPGTIDDLYAGVSDDGAGNHCGYLQMDSSAFGPSGNLLEAVQAVCNGHVGMPQDQIDTNVTVPGACTALAECMTFTYTFPYPYYNNAGVPAQPLCLPPSLYEIGSGSTDIWFGNVNNVTPTAVTYNIATSVATSVGKTLTLVAMCHEPNF